MTEATYIYALTDPRTEEVRYIGKTDRTPLERLKGHVDDANKDICTYKCDWIRSLLLKGLEPSLSVLEIVFIPNDWQERERWWIAFAREQGFRLTNLTDGGEGGAGMLGRKHTPESKQRMSLAKKGRPGPKVSEEARYKIGAANGRPYPAFIHEETGEIIPVGTNLSALCRERGLGDLGAVARGKQRSHKGWMLLDEARRKRNKSRKGKVRTEEQRRRMSESQKGKKLSEEHKRNISKANTGRRHSEESIQRMREAHKGKVFSDEHRRNLSISHIGNKHTEESKGKIGKAAEGNQYALGYRHTEEAKQRIGEAGRNRPGGMLGKKQSEEAKRRISIASSKPYPSFINKETGEIIPAGVNLTATCREHGLSSGSMRRVKERLQRSHKGWILLEGKI